MDVVDAVIRWTFWKKLGCIRKNNIPQNSNSSSWAYAPVLCCHFPLGGILAMVLCSECNHFNGDRDQSSKIFYQARSRNFGRYWFLRVPVQFSLTISSYHICLVPPSTIAVSSSSCHRHSIKENIYAIGIARSELTNNYFLLVSHLILKITFGSIQSIFWVLFPVYAVLKHHPTYKKQFRCLNAILLCLMVVEQCSVLVGTI